MVHVLEDHAMPGEVLDYCELCAVPSRCCTDCWNCRAIHCACQCGPALDNPVFDERDDMGAVDKAAERERVRLQIVG